MIRWFLPGEILNLFSLCMAERYVLTLGGAEEGIL
jgi:hypothetical protein